MKSRLEREIDRYFFSQLIEIHGVTMPTLHDTLNSSNPIEFAAWSDRSIINQLMIRIRTVHGNGMKWETNSIDWNDSSHRTKKRKEAFLLRSLAWFILGVDWMHSSCEIIHVTSASPFPAKYKGRNRKWNHSFLINSCSKRPFSSSDVRLGTFIIQAASTLIPRWATDCWCDVFQGLYFNTCVCKYPDYIKKVDAIYMYVQK